jgi:hypothetical protein
VQAFRSHDGTLFAQAVRVALSVFFHREQLSHLSVQELMDTVTVEGADTLGVSLLSAMTTHASPLVKDEDPSFHFLCSYFTVTPSWMVLDPEGDIELVEYLRVY